jgi:DNA-binding transcriptional regulator YhcF (GntR family)
MFHIDPDDPTPVHTQIVRSVRASIGAGVLEPGDELPTVRQVAVELRINANAVERAYRELERMGVVEHRAGTGFFLADVRPPHDEALLAQLAAPRRDHHPPRQPPIGLRTRPCPEPVSSPFAASCPP